VNKRLPWFEVVLIVVVMSISVRAALSDAQNFSLRWFTRDDAYYYFKVAQNISEGHGSTFDGINRTNGYHPLWMLICIPIFALARFDLILPLRILFLVMSVLSIATALLLYRLLGRMIAPAIGALAAIYWVFSFDIIVNIYQQGLESGIAAFFIVLFLYKLYQFELGWRTQEPSQKQLVVLGAIGALTIFSRLDLIFFVGLAGLWIILRGNLLRLFLPLDGTLVVGSILLAFILRLGLPEYYAFADVAILTAGLSLVVKVVSAFAFGLYQRETTGNIRLFLTRLTFTTLTSSTLLAGIMIVVSQIGDFAGFPRMVLVWDFAFTLLGFGLTRVAYIHWHGKFEKVKPANPFVEIRNIWMNWLREGFIYFGISFGMLALYMIWSKFTFGTFSPVSGQIKRWWGSFPARVYGGATRNPFDFFGIAFEGDGLGWTPIVNRLGGWISHSTNISAEMEARYVISLAAVIIVAFILLSLNTPISRRAVTQLGLIPLISGATLQAMYYHAQGYSAYKGWYWVSQRIAAILVICLIIGILFTLTRKLPYRQVFSWVVVVYFGFTMGQAYGAGMDNIMRYNRWPSGTPYMEIAVLLEDNTEPGSLVGFTGGGNVGYFIAGRTIVNMDGLINSHAYFEALQAGRAGEFLSGMGLDYVLANPALLDQLPYNGQFDAYLEPTNIFYGGKQLLKFRLPGDDSASNEADT
jgi:hypothetical protein